MSDANLFEYASRNKLRFASFVGALTVEQLWDLPLLAGSRSDRKIDLDTVARGINADLKSITEESFVAVKPNPRQKELTIALDLVKHIIAVKQTEAAAAKEKADKAAKRSKLIEALAAQEDKELQSMSKDDIMKELKALDD